MKLDRRFVMFIVLATLVFYSSASMAGLAYVDPGTNLTVLDQVVDKFSQNVQGWQGIIQTAAENLFWSLVLISMVWTFGMLILRKADIGDFFAEFTRFIIFTGFYFWLLTNAVSGQDIAGTIIESMQILGNNASGLPNGSNYSSVMDVGYDIWSLTSSSLNLLQPVDSFISIVLALIILIVLAVIAVNMLLLLIAGWVLMYAGIFFLGFGGARWTSDIAINYFKTVLGLGIQLLAMILIIGIGNSLLTSFHASMSTSALNYEELGVMTVFSITLLILSSRLPALLSGIITGSSIGSVGAGSIGGASVFGAGMATGGTIGAAAGMVASKIGSIDSGIQAIKGALAGQGSGGIEDAVKMQSAPPEGFSSPKGGADMPSMSPSIPNTTPLPKDDPRY